MNTELPALTFALFLFSAPVQAQYNYIPITPAETESYSLDNTPFPTGAGKATRTQYLLHSDMLEQAGLQPNMSVYGVSLMVVDSDAVDPACLVTMHVAMKNDVTVSFTDFVYNGFTAAGDVNPLTIPSGVWGIGFTTPWQWAGAGHNAVLEISWERGEDLGVSPRIMLDTALDYTATYTARTQQSVPANVITSAYPSDVQTGSDNSLPALGFLVYSPTTVVEYDPRFVSCLWPNPASETINVEMPLSTDRVRIIDPMGRIVLDQAANAGSTTVAIQDLSTGCYMLQAMSGGRMLVSNRFVKD